MKVAIFVLLVACVVTQAPVPTSKWICCEQNSMWVPTWGTKCAGARRLQAVVEKACPRKLETPKTRILQALQHPVAPACTNMNAKRRTQAVRVKKPKVKIHVRVKPRVHVRVKHCKMKRGIVCASGWHTNYDKGHGWGKARCCRYVNRARRMQAVRVKKPKVKIHVRVKPRVHVRVKHCKMKRGIICAHGWHTNYDKGHGWGKARCCRYVKRARRMQVPVKPKPKPGVHKRVRDCKWKRRRRCQKGWFTWYKEGHGRGRARCCRWVKRKPIVPQPKPKHIEIKPIPVAVVPFVPLRAGCYQKFPRLWCGSGFSTVRPMPYNNMTVNCCPSKLRRTQAVVKTYKCPVNIEGQQCFLNNTNKKCA